MEARYESSFDHASETMPGVTLRIRRMSFGRRLELARKVRELGRRLDFEAAGTGLAARVEESVLRSEIERIYVEWGVAGVDGLEVDGHACEGAAELLEAGPEALVKEALGVVQRELGLTEADAKN